MATLTFLGATGCVTGSRYVLDVHGKRVMVDAGLFQGPKELRLRNWTPFQVDASSLDAIILTHSHIDHSGFLPRLVREGFSGPVLVTPPTVRLLQVLLPDAAHLQEEEARFANKVGSTRHSPALPLFNAADARAALDLLAPVPFGAQYELAPGIEFSFQRQGHILGAASVKVRFKTAGGNHCTVVFSGDVGRYDAPILWPPEPFPGADYLVVESTYGDRLHDPGDPKDQLAEVINSTAQRTGVVVIPAFAVDRAQQILYYLHELLAEELIPAMPIFLDSPMARQATAAYQQFKKEHDVEMRAMVQEGKDPLAPRGLTVVGNRRESQRINSQNGPAIIISASGMATGGRVLHHLRHRLARPENTVFFVGYQAAGTRGRRMVDGEQEIKIFGDMIPVRARVVQSHSLSSHADADEIMIWLDREVSPPQTTFVTHGEPDAARAMAELLKSRLDWTCAIPDLEESFTL